MSKLLLINQAENYGSTGKIVEQIGLLAKSKGWEVRIAHSVRYQHDGKLQSLPFSNLFSERWHALWAFLADRQGLLSTRETKRLVRGIIDFKPDIIHLHNVHGYFINYVVLFKYLATANIPIVWTMHDCWSFTGHCAFFDMVSCERWKNQCYSCPNLAGYPKAMVGRSKKNYNLKKELFTSLVNLTMVPVSNWLGGLTQNSFLGRNPIVVIHNGVDINTFRILSDIKETSSKKLVLGVSSNGFTGRKGLKDFVALSTLLPQDYQIVLIGLRKEESSKIPKTIIGIARTANVEELVGYYNKASVFVNPTYSDNFPTTNIEALACGTPVVTYNTGGSPEAIDESTGIVVEQGDVNELARSIIKITNIPKPSSICRKRAEDLFNKDKCFNSYINLYNSLIKNE